jgi:hypothetical protein
LTPVLAVVGLVLWWRRARGLAAVLGIAAAVPILLALGTNTPLYSPLWHALPPLQFPRVPARLLPLTDLALAALAAFAAAHLIRRFRGVAVPVAAALFVAVAADLAVQPLESAAADPGNAAYRALAQAPPGRVLELPLVEPGVHYGSVYDYYATQAPRERLSGYSTLAPESAVAFYFRMNRLSCGVWLPGDRDAIAALGVENVVFHRGVYRQMRVPGAWFAWRGLQDLGYRPAAGTNTVTFFAEAGDIAAPPVPEPAADRPVLCEGWRGRRMVEREASFWINGSGALELHVRAPGRIAVQMWVDGRPGGTVDIAGETTFSVPLGTSRWHSVTFAVPRLFSTKPPSGLRIERLIVRPSEP